MCTSSTINLFSDNPKIGYLGVSFSGDAAQQVDEADGRKILFVMQRLSAAAHFRRYVAWI